MEQNVEGVAHGTGHLLEEGGGHWYGTKYGGSKVRRQTHCKPTSNKDPLCGDRNQSADTVRGEMGRRGNLGE